MVVWQQIQVARRLPMTARMETYQKLPTQDIHLMAGLQKMALKLLAQQQ